MLKSENQEAGSKFLKGQEVEAVTDSLRKGVAGSARAHTEPSR